MKITKRTQQIVDYLLETGESYEEVGQHFGITRQAVEIHWRKVRHDDGYQEERDQAVQNRKLGILAYLKGDDLVAIEEKFSDLAVMGKTFDVSKKVLRDAGITARKERNYPKPQAEERVKQYESFFHVYMTTSPTPTMKDFCKWANDNGHFNQGWLVVTNDIRIVRDMNPSSWMHSLGYEPPKTRKDRSDKLSADKALAELQRFIKETGVTSADQYGKWQVGQAPSRITIQKALRGSWRECVAMAKS